MLKQTVTYTDFDDVRQTETLYFNLSRADVADNLDLEDEYKDLYRMLQGEERELKTAEKQKMLDFIKRLIRISYGERSLDGRHFRKSEQIYDDFRSTNAYDEFLFSLFQDVDRAVAFMNGIMPQDALREAQKAIDEGRVNPDGSIRQEAPLPKWKQEGRLPRPEEFANMSKEELALAMAEKQKRAANA